MLKKIKKIKNIYKNSEILILYITEISGNKTCNKMYNCSIKMQYNFYIKIISNSLVCIHKYCFTPIRFYLLSSLSGDFVSLLRYAHIEKEKKNSQIHNVETHANVH